LAHASGESGMSAGSGASPVTGSAAATSSAGVDLSAISGLPDSTPTSNQQFRCNPSTVMVAQVSASPVGAGSPASSGLSASAGSPASAGLSPVTDSSAFFPPDHSTAQPPQIKQPSPASTSVVTKDGCYVSAIHPVRKNAAGIKQNRTRCASFRLPGAHSNHECVTWSGEAYHNSRMRCNHLVTQLPPVQN
jgi:hypothetical protein